MQVQFDKEQKKEEFKVAIVGPSKPKWKNLQQYTLMQHWIRHLIKVYQTGHKPIILTEGGVPYPSPVSFGIGEKYEGELVIVSGHCPVGEERYYCCDHKMFLPSNWRLEEHIGHTVIKVYDQGGVDTEIEIIANELKVKTEIYSAEIRQWEDKTFYFEDEFEGVIAVDKKGYRSRNIQIAESDAVYCTVPQTYIPLKDEEVLTDLPSDIYCWHCGELGHPKNGGCWTLQRAKKLGKETHLVVIR